jgi:hypothetical protein
MTEMLKLLASGTDHTASFSIKQTVFVMSVCGFDGPLSFLLYVDNDFNGQEFIC